jgi:hypothetical protein
MGFVSFHDKWKPNSLRGIKPWVKTIILEDKEYYYSARCLPVFCKFAQQDAQFTQYMYNTINVRLMLGRENIVYLLYIITQWVGLDGAPVTNTVSINTPNVEVN